MKIMIEDTNGILSVKSDGRVKTDDALKALMMATAETLTQALKPGLSQKAVDCIFKEFGESMTDAASARYKMLHDAETGTGFSDKEKGFLSALFKS